MTLRKVIIFIKFSTDQVCLFRIKTTSQQSILQNQIEKFGRNIFKEGTVISGGEVGLDKKYLVVKVQGTFKHWLDITSNISSCVGTTIITVILQV